MNTPPLTILHGDCLEHLRSLPDNSVDSVVTDPPYGLSFMGKKWDYDVPSVEVWAECLRVLKPGGHLLAFAGTRTQHRMAVRIEDAGFEIRDMIAWVYGSGFPKSHNLEDEWQGWGTALKPALEPITVARKPLVGTVAANVQEHGTGALNVDGCRVLGVKPDTTRGAGGLNGRYGQLGAQGRIKDDGLGRWPANLIHDGSEEVVELFPVTKTGICPADGAGGYNGGLRRRCNAAALNGGDTGSAARFFYCAKASKADRDEGLGGMPRRNNMRVNAPRENEEQKHASKTANHHPTVKPTALMRYLCRLVTPPGGVVLDPFMGSGSTGKAAILEGFGFIGCEREAEYVEIARARIKRETAQQSFDFDAAGGK
jgi:DNA modification methylase